MKKILAIFALCAATGMAADVTGYIVDKNCAGKKAMWTNEQCSKACIEKGSPAVLVTEDGKVYNVANQDKVKESAGKKVTVTGDIAGDTITVANLTIAKT